MTFPFTIQAALLAQWQRHAQRQFPELCRPRPDECNKGSFGTLAMVGGTSGMSGAVILAGIAALKNGCGKVWLGFHQNTLPLPVLPEHPEIMLATAAQLRQRNDITTWVVGCGLGTDCTAAALLADILQHTDTPLLLDADALNILSQHDDFLPFLHQRRQPAILTPHPAEAARLLHCTTADIQANRHQAARRLAERYCAWIVLKGHHSLTASPDGRITVNESGNAGLATAGSGDVLSGIIGSLLAQHLPIEQAVAGGVWLHGAAADLLVGNGIGPIGLCAGEIADSARFLRNRLNSNLSV